MTKTPDIEKAYRIPDLIALRPYSKEFSNFGNDYVFSHLGGRDMKGDFSDSPIRIDGITTILCTEGEIDIEVDLMPYKLTRNSMMIISRGNLLQIKNIDWSNIDACIFVISSYFINDVNLDMNVLNTMKIGDNHTNPMLNVSADEMQLLWRYVDLIHHNTVGNSDDIYVRSISRCLIASLFYQVMQIASRYRAGHEEDEMGNRIAAQRGLSRKSLYVKEFMRLVQEHHMRERSLSFYASQLAISPKYLSVIIRDVTGRTATRWIDDYVILEAKNLLRFSGRTIQQISNDLNFGSQSAFGKYFKKCTGMSPTSYQRS